jgi:hypothetical protein
LDYSREISNNKITVAIQQRINSEKATVFSARSVPRCYKQDKPEAELRFQIGFWSSVFNDRPELRKDDTPATPNDPRRRLISKSG